MSEDIETQNFLDDEVAIEDKKLSKRFIAGILFLMTICICVGFCGFLLPNTTIYDSLIETNGLIISSLKNESSSGFWNYYLTFQYNISQELVTDFGTKETQIKFVGIPGPEYDQGNFVLIFPSVCPRGPISVEDQKICSDHGIKTELFLVKKENMPSPQNLTMIIGFSFAGLQLLITILFIYFWK